MYAFGSHKCSGNNASFSVMPTVRKVNATGIVRLLATSGMRSARSAMLSVPVITYNRPIPITMNVAPKLPMIRYWNDAVSALRSCPIAMSA